MRKSDLVRDGQMLTENRLLKRRQIRNSRPCAIATCLLLIQVVKKWKGSDPGKLIRRVRDVGLRLTSAQPREMAVGNIVRRVLGLIREVAEEGTTGEGLGYNDEPLAVPPPPADSHFPRDSMQRPSLQSSMSTFSPLKHGALGPVDSNFHSADTPSDDTDGPPSRPSLTSSQTSYAATATPLVGSLFGLFQHPDAASGSSSPIPPGSPNGKLTDMTSEKQDLKGEVIQGIKDLKDELNQVDDQIAEYALDHIHSNEIILTHSSSTTVQKFLLAAAKKRKFTVVHVEGYPNDHVNTHATVLHGRHVEYAGDSEKDGNDEKFKSLTAAGITVILIPDSAVFAIMSRVNKVILATHTVLANGSLVAAAGARTIAQAAKVHQTPVVVVSGVYKLSPVYPFDTEELIEYGDAGNVVNYDDGEFVTKVDVVNPLYDYVPPDLVDLYITNLGGHAPSYLYRIVADHYRPEDTRLDY